jgi:hypothetical protein
MQMGKQKSDTEYFKLLVLSERRKMHRHWAYAACYGGASCLYLWILPPSVYLALWVGILVSVMLLLAGVIMQIDNRYRPLESVVESSAIRMAAPLLPVLVGSTVVAYVAATLDLLTTKPGLSESTLIACKAVSFYLTSFGFAAIFYAFQVYFASHRSEKFIFYEEDVLITETRLSHEWNAAFLSIKGLDESGAAFKKRINLSTRDEIRQNEVSCALQLQPGARVAAVHTGFGSFILSIKSQPEAGSHR